MGRLLKDPTVRLAGRALVAALLVAVTQIHAAAGGTIAWRSLAVGAGLAFCEVFTPLNGLVGVFKTPAPASAPAPAPAVRRRR